jgi:DeoR family transcriptional regulator, suf operon transcriptional repressor
MTTASLNHALESLPPSRRALLVELKRRGTARADDLAGTLGVTASAVRQQLAALVEEGLVEYRDLRGQRGRPRRRYRLAAAGEAFFPRTYAALTNELLDYARDDDPELVPRIFSRRRRRRAEDARERLAGKAFGERVAELAAILDEDGYLADFAEVEPGRFRITEHNCAILDVARRYGQACSSELGFLRDALPDAEVRRVAHMIAGAHVCAYEVVERPAP